MRRAAAIAAPFYFGTMRMTLGPLYGSKVISVQSLPSPKRLAEPGRQEAGSVR